MPAPSTRTEHDMLGAREILQGTRYGAHTVRALENFPRLGPRVADVPEFGRALGMVKLAAARANVACGALDPVLGAVLQQACRELVDDLAGLRGGLVVPLLQGGAGTSTNMNVNEVLANRTLQLLGHAPGSYAHCHPNDHVNRSQSTNDVYPTALRVALALRHRGIVAPALDQLVAALRAAARSAAGVPKLGRTQLQDAVPMTADQEILGWADAVQGAARALAAATAALHEVNLGGTAIGTGLAAPEGYQELAVRELAVIAGLPLQAAERGVSATTDPVALVGLSGALRTVAVALGKVANDLRLLSSGPRTGLAEYRLPALQAGSSMMPGKVNPVIPEFINQIGFRVRGLDATATLALDAGQLQLNAMLPAVAQALFESQELLACGAATFAERCIAGLELDAERMGRAAGDGLGEVTVLAAAAGYGAAAELAWRRRASSPG